MSTCTVGLASDGKPAAEWFERSIMDVMAQRAKLRDELLRRVQRDQEARHQLGNPPTTEQWEVVKAVDAENSPWLEDVVSEHGWPGIGQVGADAAHAAWLIAQHAPLHLQHRWLPFLRDAVEVGDARAVHLAYLDDRVRMREQRPQRHGTQWRGHPGEHRLFPLEDPDGVNDRRIALGLSAIAQNDLDNALPSHQADTNPDA